MKQNHSTVSSTIAIALALVTCLSLAACGVRINPASTGDAVASGYVTAPPEPSAAAGPSGAPSATPSPSPTPTNLVRAVVFDTTLDERSEDPSFTKYDDTLKMTLYETSPNVFEGKGVNILDFVSEDSALRYWYNLDRLKLTPGSAVTVDPRAWYDGTVTLNDSTSYMDDSDIGGTTIRGYYTESPTLPFTLSLTVAGDTAKFTISANGYDTAYDGKCVTVPPPVPTVTLPAETNISINTTYHDNDQPINHQHRAILTASPSGNGYTGNLFLYSDGGDLPSCDEAVTFTLAPFDQKAYTAAGGVLTGEYDGMGVIHASAGDFLVLIDDDRALLEPAGQEAYFYGYFIADKDVTEARRVADETKPLCKFLYDNSKSKTSNNNSDPMYDGVAPWYPTWLMPKPGSTDHWMYHAIRSMYPVNLYSAKYFEQDRFPDKVLPDYKAQLAGYDSLEAILDTNTNDGVIRFKKGAFVVRMLLLYDPFSVGTDVDIDIYE